MCRAIILILSLILLAGCASMMGGGFYENKKWDAATGNLILDTKVRSLREWENGNFYFSPDGAISANITGVKAGPNTITEIADSLTAAFLAGVKAGKAGAL